MIPLWFISDDEFWAVSAYARDEQKLRLTIGSANYNTLVVSEVELAKWQAYASDPNREAARLAVTKINSLVERNLIPTWIANDNAMFNDMATEYRRVCQLAGEDPEPQINLWLVRYGMEGDHG